MMKDITRIDRYEPVVVGPGVVKYYAVAGKRRIPMPDCYKEMYDNNHLAVTKVSLEMPELFDEREREQYIPLYTGTIV